MPHDIPNRNAELEVTGSTLRGPGFSMPTGGTDTECSGLSEDAGTDEIVPSPPLQCPCRPRGRNSPADLLERLAHRAQIGQGSGKGGVELFLTRMGHGTCEAFFLVRNERHNTIINAAGMRAVHIFMPIHLNIRQTENFPGNLSRFKSVNWPEMRWVGVRWTGPAQPLVDALTPGCPTRPSPCPPS